MKARSNTAYVKRRILLHIFLLISLLIPYAMFIQTDTALASSPPQITIPPEWQIQSVREYDLLGKSYRVRFYLAQDPLFGGIVPVVTTLPNPDDSDYERILGDHQELEAVALYSLLDWYDVKYSLGIFDRDWDSTALNWQDMADESDPSKVDFYLTLIYVGKALFSIGLGFLFPQSVPTSLATLSHLGLAVSLSADLMNMVGDWLSVPTNNELQAVIQATVDLDPSQEEALDSALQTITTLEYLKRGQNDVDNDLEQMSIVLHALQYRDALPSIFSWTAADGSVILVSNPQALIRASTIVPNIILNSQLEGLGENTKAAVVSYHWHAMANTALANSLDHDIKAIPSANTPQDLIFLTTGIEKKVDYFYKIQYEMGYVFHHYLSVINDMSWVGDWLLPDEDLTTMATNNERVKDHSDLVSAAIESISLSYEYFLELTYPDFAGIFEPVSLSNPAVNPESWSSSLTPEWTFTIDYASPSNTAPEYVRLNLGGDPFDMVQQDSSDTDYTDGVTFTYVHGPLATGSYSYSFEASDGASQTSSGTFTLKVTTPQASTVPVESDASSIPLDGVSKSLITATVTTAAGQPMQGVQVTFGCSGVSGGFTLIDTGETWHRVDTDVNGQARIYFKPRSSGTATVTATLDSGLSGSAEIEVTGSNDVGLRIRFIRDSDLVYTVHIDAVYLANGDPIQFEDVTISTSRGTLTAVGNPSINGSSITIKTNSSDGGSYVGAVKARLAIPSEGDTTITATVRSVSESVTSYLGGEPAWIRPFLHLSEDRAADWSYDGSKIAVGGSDSLVHVYDTTTWNQLIQWQPEDGFANTVYDLSFAPDRDEIAIAGRYATRERVSDGYKIWEGNMLGTRHVDWSPDGSWIAGGGRHETLIYTLSGSQAQSISHTDDWIRSLAFSPDGEYLLMGHDSGRVRIVRTSNWSTLIDFYSDPDADENDEVWAAAWSPESSKYVISTAELGLLLFNRTSSSPYASYTGHGIPSGVDALAWCPISDMGNPGYGKIASSAGASLHIWNAETQQPLLQAPNSGANRALAWSPDCELLVFPGGVVAPWDTVGPDIEVSSHFNGQVVLNSPITLEGNIQDSFFVDAATYSLNGGPATNLSLDVNGDFAQSINLVAGDNTITLNAEDGTGNPSSMELTITLLTDQSAPLISIPVGGTSGSMSVELGVLTTIYVAIEDPWSGVDPSTVSTHIQYPDGIDLASITLYDNGTGGGDELAGDGIFTGQWDSSPAPEEGIYFIDVEASDNVGNPAQADNLILIEFYDVPIITQIVHTPLEPMDTESVFVKTQVTDPSGISQVLLEYSSDDGSSYTPINMMYNGITNEYEGTIPPQNMGEILYRIVGQDTGEHQSSSSEYSYTVIDSSAPYIISWGQTPSDLSAGWSGSFQVQFSVHDIGGSGLSGMIPQLHYKRGSTDADYTAYADMTSISGEIWSFDIPMPAGGWQEIECENLAWDVQASDVAGNTGTSETKIEFVDDDDSLGPDINLSSYPQSVAAEDTLSINVMISDSTTGNHGVSEAILHYGYSFPDESWSVTGVGPGGNGDGQWTFIIPAQGQDNEGRTFRFYITAVDDDSIPAYSFENDSGQYFTVYVLGEYKIYLPLLIKSD